MTGWTYTLRELAGAIGPADAIGAEAASDVAFSAVSTDTRTLQPGDVFFALTGENLDGNRSALKRLDEFFGILKQSLDRRRVVESAA